MSRMRGDIAVAKQSALVDISVELRARRLVIDVARPADEIRHRLRRPVTVERLDDETARRQIARHGGERLRRLPRQQATPSLVTVDRPRGEIMRSRVAHL